MTPHHRRLLRQFAMLERKIPALRSPIHALVQGRWRMLRAPLALLLIIGGLMSFLPFLGVWMLPLGLLLIALDIPAAQPIVSAMIIRARRRIETWARQLRRLRRT